MENLVSSELVVSVVGGGIIAVIVQLLKGRLKKYNPRWVVTLFSLLAGVIYYSFSKYVPEALQQNIVNFVYGTLSSAVFIYAFIWKGIKGQEVTQQKIVKKLSKKK